VGQASGLSLPSLRTPSENNPELSKWATSIETLIASGRLTIISRVMVFSEVSSTQDAARRAASSTPGVLVLAGRQTAGRGRLGRSWADTSSMGVAATFAIDASRHTDARLSLAAGIAALHACESILGPGRLGLRWPNDVVERAVTCSPSQEEVEGVGTGQRPVPRDWVEEEGTGQRPVPRGLVEKAGASQSVAPRNRKLAGVLIERDRSLALVGIGINVSQHAADWPPALQNSAVSLAQLGITTTRKNVIETLALCLDRALHQSEPDLVALWKRAETLLGSRRTFLHDGQHYHGTILDIDPLHSIRLRLSDGSERLLPALSTSIVHPATDPHTR
jgi:biotin-(acetyl-CoA carboxylase) ligase